MDIIREDKRRKLNRPVTGKIQEDRIWEQWYEKEVFEKPFPQKNQKDYLLECNQGYENQIILNNRGEKKFTVGTLDEKANDYAIALEEKGYQKGDIICTIGLSTPELVFLKYACLDLGIITSNLNFMNTQEKNDALNELYNKIKLLNPRAIFFLDILESNIYEILNLQEFQGIEKIRMPLEESMPIFTVEQLKVKTLNLSNQIQQKTVKKAISLSRFLKLENKTERHIESIYDFRLPSNISFTSGTTGINKAVLLSHDANNALAYQHKLANLGLKRGEKHLVLVPPFLAFWDADMIHMAMCMGIENILELNLSYESIPKYLLKYLPQYGIWSQYLWDSILHLPKKDLEKISHHLHKVVIGGERCEKNQADSFYQKTGIIQETGYGATEVNTCFSVANPNCNVSGSAGIPLPFNNVKIVDESFQDVSYNTPGRLLITGPCLMNGYYGREDLTKQALIKDDKGITWYNTGDYARMDTNGNLFVLDRIAKPIEIVDKDGIKHEIQLLDIVEKIKTDRNIKICKLNSYNNRIILYVVLDEFYVKDEEIAIESIKTTIQTNLEEKYWPNIIKVESTLPRTQVGKVDYKKIEEETKELSLTIGIEEKLNVINELESKKNKIKQRVKQCREK